MGASESKPPALPLGDPLHNSEPHTGTATPSAGVAHMGHQPYPDDVTTLEQVSNAYKEGTAARVLTKVAMAGTLGVVCGPFVHSGPVLAASLVAGANGVAVVGFYDVLREALNSVTLSDTPILSLVAGALTGGAPQALALQPVNLVKCVEKTGHV